MPQNKNQAQNTTHPASPVSVLSAPWRGIAHPQAAARCFAAASTKSFLAVFLIHAMLLAAAVVALAMWAATVQQTSYGSLLPLTGPGGFVQRTEIRGLDDVWRAWHSHGTFGPAEQLFLGVLALTVAAALLLAWINLPLIHRSGSLSSSFERSARAVASMIAVMLSIVAMVGLAVVTVRLGRHFGWWSANTFPKPENYVAILVGGAACGLFWWIGRAVQVVAEASNAPELPPVCEGCGYDLTHQPADRLCPECGASVDLSLSMGAKRRGCAWERRKSLGSALATAKNVLLRPRRFYAELKLRTPLRPARTYCCCNYAAMSIGAMIWIALLETLVPSGLGGSSNGVLFAVGMFAVWTPAVCWIGHRLGAAVVMSWWAVRGELPDYRWFAKVLAYESVYLWVYCTFWGVLVTSISLFDAWVGGLLGRRFGALGLPVELIALIWGTIALSVLWWLRYAVALRAIRWSNF